jgi:capsular polysaccharide export protein
LHHTERPDAALKAQALTFADQISAAQVGGRFWTQKLIDGPERIVLRPATLGVLDDAIRQALRAHAAGDILLLADRMPRSTAERVRRLGMTMVTGAVDPWSVLARARAMYVGGDDELAFLGLLAGVPVHCHAPGLASGWGLTIDSPALPSMIAAYGTRSLGDLAAALLLQGVRYGDPRTGQLMDCAGAIALLTEWRDLVRRNRAVGCCVGVSFWKRARLAGFFHNGERPPKFCSQTAAALATARGRAVAGWNSRLPNGL